MTNEELNAITIADVRRMLEAAPPDMLARDDVFSLCLSGRQFLALLRDGWPESGEMTMFAGKKMVKVKCMVVK